MCHPRSSLRCQTAAHPPQRASLQWVIAHHQPIFLAGRGPTSCHIDRAITLLGDRDMMPEERLPGRQRNAIHVAAALPITIDPKTPVDPDAPMPPQSCEMFHKMGVGEPTIGSKDDAAPHGQQLCHLRQHLLRDVIGHTPAGMFKAFPHARHCPSTIDEREAHQTLGMPQRGRPYRTEEEIEAERQDFRRGNDRIEEMYRQVKGKGRNGTSET